MYFFVFVSQRFYQSPLWYPQPSIPSIITQIQGTMFGKVVSIFRLRNHGFGTSVWVPDAESPTSFFFKKKKQEIAIVFIFF